MPLTTVGKGFNNAGKEPVGASLPRSYRAHSLLGVETEHVTGHGFGNANAIHPG